MREPEEILTLWRQRKQNEGPWAQRAREVRDLYGGDIAVPLPELDTIEKPAVANLMRMGLDQMGTRVASVLPDVRFPTRNPGIKAQQDRSRKKRQAVFGWWDHNRMGLKMYRRGRWLLAYAKAPVVIRPDFGKGVPRWDLRDPLGVYEGARVDPTDPCVPDVICSVKRSYQWLKWNYPEHAQVLSKPQDCPPDYVFDVLEWIDAHETVLVVVGSDQDDNQQWTGLTPGAKVLELERTENRIGYCPATVPASLGLADPRGQFDGMVGLHQMQARLMALEVIAVEKDIFPDDWLIADAQSSPDVVQVANGRQGIVGIVKGGQFRQVQHPPGYQTMPTVDRLERAQRLSGGIPPDFGGESATNVRTGRRGENILSATIDFTIQEAQQTFASTLEAENRIAINIAKEYLDRPTSFYVSWHRAKGFVDYTPSDLFDTDQNVVTYAMAGSDIQGMVIAGGQRVGMGTMSRRSFMEIDPLVDDPETEADRVVVEALQDAYLQSVQARAANGELPEVDLVRVMELVEQDKMNLVSAVRKAQEEAQERQAQQVPEGDPAAQPGMAMPGMGAEAGVEAAPGPEDLAQILGSLRFAQRQSPAEQGVPEAVV